ncbi:MAG: hypothetical protein CMH04_01050 [Marinovum sp.]|nr:hypothetical protein [Marinovum sp.]
MIILRIFLYLVCIISLGWSILVFVGPTLIKRVMIAYSDGAVVPSAVKVSPALGISVGRLDFSFRTSTDKRVVGFSRSTEISWSLSENQPFLTFDFGPTVFEDIALAENFKVYSLSYENFELDDLSFFASAQSLNLQNFGKIHDLRIAGTLNYSLFKFYDLNFKAENINLQNDTSSLKAGSISGVIKQFEFDTPMSDQLILSNFIAGDIIGIDPKFNILKAAGNIELYRASNNFTVELGNVNFPTSDVAINNIEIDGAYDLARGLQEVNVNFFNGAFAGGQPTFSSILTNLSERDAKYYDGYAEGQLDEFELYNSGSFLGSIPSNKFKIKFSLDRLISKATSKLEFSFDSLMSAVVGGFAEVDLKINDFNHLFNCPLLDCKFSDFNLSYKINFDDDWVKGRAVCANTRCGIGSLRHDLNTSDTINILKIINEAGIVSPLTSMYLYNAISSGKKVNDGHELTF